MEKQEVLHISVCACVRTHARAPYGWRHGFACVHASMCVRACVCEWIGVSARVRKYASLLIQYVTPRRHIVRVLSPIYFSILSHKRHDFREKKSLNIKCVFWFFLQLLFETFLILRRIQWDIIINVKTSSCKLPVILSDFNKTWIFTIYFRKKSQISRFVKIRPMGAEFFHAEEQTDGQTDMTKLIVVFAILQTHHKKQCSSTS